MLWYGYTYYTLFNLLLLGSMFFTLRLFFLNSVVRFNSHLLLNKILLSFGNFFLLVTTLLLNTLLGYYQGQVYVNGLLPDTSINYSGLYVFDSMLPLTPVGINLVQVYVYPFVYVFLLVTVLSIVYCLSYNADELVSFMFYCQVILASGYVLFFTDSIVLFFFSYEMLLMPSFFILYRFAKTRRCVEAAYLMFFWTQFGALFLIFALMYLFLVSDTSSFSLISLVNFSDLEVNFIFLTCLIGFGVKLPIWPFYG